MLQFTISRYVKDGLAQNGMSYRELSARSGVPISTISAYARGQVESPDADNLARIAQAFGDSPDAVAQLRAQAEAQAEEDARIAAEASDKELVERIVSTLRQTFDGLLDTPTRSIRSASPPCKSNTGTIWQTPSSAMPSGWRPNSATTHRSSSRCGKACRRWISVARRDGATSSALCARWRRLSWCSWCCWAYSPRMACMRSMHSTETTPRGEFTGRKINE